MEDRDAMNEAGLEVAVFRPVMNEEKVLEEHLVEMVKLKVDKVEPIKMITQEVLLVMIKAIGNLTSHHLYIFKS